MWLLGIVAAAMALLGAAIRRILATSPGVPEARRGKERSAGLHCPSCGLEHEPDAKVCRNPKCGIRF